MRRTTLGGLSDAQVNARAAGAGRVVNSQAAKQKRMTLGPGTRPSTGRLSGGQPRGGSLVRRSSVYGKGPEKRTDPRPITEKSYQANCVHRLIAYLTAHNYDHAISPTLLKAPSAKEFNHIALFLFRRVDSNVNLVGKIEDEIPLIFKRQGYPFPISKSALQAVGSMHTWPPLLAALAWFVELLEYEERVEECKADNNLDAGDSGAKEFFNFVMETYHHFLLGNDDQCEVLLDRLAESFQVRDAAILEEIGRLEQANEQLTAELRAAREEPSPLEQLQRKRDDMSVDVGKFHKLVSNLQQHNKQLEQRLEEKKADHSAMQSELGEIEEEIEELKDRVAAQEINAEDVERMTREKHKIEEILRSVTAQNEDLEKTVWQQEMQSSKKLEDLDTLVRQYHSRAQQLKLIPATAKRAEGVSFEVRLNSLALSPEEMLNVDLKETVRPALGRLRDTYSKRERDARDAMLALHERLDAGEEAVAERQEQNAALEEKHRKAEAHFKAEKERLEGSLRAITAELESTEAAVAQLRAGLGSNAAEAEEIHKSLIGEYEELVAATSREKRDLSDELMSAANLLIDHKGYIESILIRVHENTAKVAQRLSTPLN